MAQGIRLEGKVCKLICPASTRGLMKYRRPILRVKFGHLEKNNERRRQIASRYHDAISGRGIQAPADIPDTTHAMHLYVIECEEREKLREYLNDRGIGTAGPLSARHTSATGISGKDKGLRQPRQYREPL